MGAAPAMSRCSGCITGSHEGCTRAAGGYCECPCNRDQAALEPEVRSPDTPVSTVIEGEIDRYGNEHPSGWSHSELARLIEARLKAEGILT